MPNGNGNGNGKRGAPEGNTNSRKYREDYPLIAAVIMRKDGTLKDLEEAFSVSPQTIFNWQEQYPEFAEACRESKTLTNAKAENSLKKRVCGYEVEETKTTSFKTKSGEVVTKIEKTKRHIPPDPTSIFFWLQNCAKDDWRNVSRHEITGKDGAPLRSEAVQQIALLPADKIKLITEWIAEAEKDAQSKAPEQQG